MPLSEDAKEPAPPGPPRAGFVAANLPVLLVLIGLVAAAQWAFWHNSDPLLFPDSHSYQKPVPGILQGEWTGFHFRTPGYPAFLAAVQAVAGLENFRAVVAVQFLLGSMVPLLLFWIYRPLLRNRWLALLPALLPFFDWVSVGTQASILTEPLTQVLLVVSVALFIKGAMDSPWWAAPALGLSLAALLLVRPAFQLLPWCLLGLGLLNAMWRNVPWRRTLAWWGIALVVAQGFTFAWCTRVYRETGHFTVSMLTGIALINHMGPIVHEVPEGQFEPWRSTHLDILRELEGDHINAGYPGMARMVASEGMPEWEVAEGYKRMSTWLMRHHPGFYLRSVGRAFHASLVDPPNYLAEPSRLASYAREHGPWATIYRFLDAQYWQRPGRLLATPVLFIAGVAGYLVLRRRDRRAVLTALAIAGTVGYSLLLHAAVNSTEMGRYRLAVQPLYLPFLLFLLVWAAEALWHRRVARRIPREISQA